MGAVGKRNWYVPDMFLPESMDTQPYAGHESVCVMNTGDNDGEIEAILYFTDREPMVCVPFPCPAKRSVHMRLNDLTDAAGNHMPIGTPYSAAFHSSTPVILQCTRVDTTQNNLALMSAIAYWE